MLESQQKKINDSNLERVVQQDEYLYFVTKDGKDMPLETHFKLPVPDRRLQVKEDSLANLRNILLKTHKREDHPEEKKDFNIG